MTKLTKAQINAILDDGRHPAEPRAANAGRLRQYMISNPGPGGDTVDGVWDAVLALTGRDGRRANALARIRKRIPALRSRPGPGGSTRWAVAANHRVHEARSLFIEEMRDAPAELVDALRGLGGRTDPEDAVARVEALVAGTVADIHSASTEVVAGFRAATDRLLGPGASGDRLAKTLRKHLADTPAYEVQHAGKGLKGALARALKFAVREVEAEMSRTRFRDVVGFADHVERLKSSRLPRRMVFHVGPTNSGKTHDAMEALAAAPDGLYLAPLRLLALEGYERLRDKGLPAGMVTGEESIAVEGATHLSMTVEMAPLDRGVEVAVLDEVQLLLDEDRGWAWTRALFGLRCRTLHLCGSVDALPLVLRAGEILGEPVEVVRHERKSPLRFEPGKVGMADIRAGDAVVAFSRKNVLLYRQLLIDAGYRVATVYGSLSPEVRRAEAARFRSGEADVLVATDAIGMGLNLGPLARVVLTATTKFDGRGTRPLRPSEIRQIAGRAGRYGHHAEGIVSVMDGDGRRILKALAGAVDREREDGLFFVKPEASTLEEAARATGTDSLCAVLKAFAERTVFEGSPYKPSDMEELMAAARAVDNVGIPVAERFAFATCPVNRNDPALAGWVAMQARNRRIGVPVPVGGRPRPAARGHGHTLEEHEREVHAMTAYLWLARKFPETFTDAEAADARRKAGNAGIEAILSRAAETKARRRTVREVADEPAA